MSGDLPRLVSWRQRIARGELIGPRMVVTGYKFGSERAVLDGAPFPLRTPADVRLAVQQVRRAGGDFVKSGAELPAALFNVLANEARRQGLPLVGHVPDSVTADHFARVGGRSIEHLSGLITGCDPLPGPSIWSRVVSVFRSGSDQVDPLRDHCTPAGMVRMEQVLLQKGVYQVPTLIQLRAMARVQGRFFDDEERRAFTPPALRQDMAPPPADRLAVMVEQFSRAKALVGELHRLGVPMMAGTDLPGTERLPGFSLVDELELLVESGLTPSEALLTATRNPAMFLGTIDSLGTIARGKVADLVMLDANPLENIRNVGRVNLVMLAGKPYTSIELQEHRTQLMAEVVRMSGSGARN
jgi:imidazolonepropionase-like amidohydrolase